MAGVNHLGPRIWTNIHQTVSSITNNQVIITNSRAGTPIDKYNETALEISAYLHLTHLSSSTSRAAGGKWALSSIAFDHQAVVETDNLNLRWFPNATHINSNLVADPKNLVFAQCGTKIKNLNSFLRDNKKSLKASGASNGQTIAGAISCGTHGSAIDFGCIHDSVLGLNIIVNEDKNYFIQRASRPVMKIDFAQSINALLINDDDLFDAALVSMGCFGFIHGVMVEVEDWFYLRNYTQSIDKNLSNRLASTLEFNDAAYPIQTHGSQRPYHFKLLVNPYKRNDNPVAEILYKLPGPSSYTRPPITDGSTYQKDTLGFIAKVSQNLPGTDALIVNLLSSLIFPKNINGKDALLCDTFTDTTTHGKTFACAIGLPIAKSAEALQALYNIIDTKGSIAAIFALRFVKKGKALLSFSRFDHTCILEIDGIRNRKLFDFMDRIPDTLRSKNIPFTFHWGKDNPANQLMVKEMYGSDFDKWVDQKSKIMSSIEASTFASQYATVLGLDQYRNTFPIYV
jgi:D-arabinono-1,4-lactone oxidase